MESQRHTAPDTPPRVEAFGTGRDPAAAESNGDGASAPPADAFRHATERLAELKEYGALYVAAKLDGLKLTLRNVLIYAALGLLAAIAGTAILVTAAVYVLSGLAGAIGEIFPNEYEWWVGRLIVGLLVLGGTFGGVIFVMKSMTGTSRKRTIRKYEQRKRDERNQFGHDVQERAREQARREEAERQPAA